MKTTWSVAAFILMLSLVPAALGAEPETKDLEAPGDCSKEEHRRLKAAVGEVCKSEPMRCEGSMECPELMSRWSKFQNCIDARQTIMDKCFRGGDQRHKNALNQYKGGQEHCMQLMLDKKCVSGECK